MTEAVIVGYARTPVGRFGGSLATLTAMELGGHAISAALRRAGVEPGQVDAVVMGHVLQAGQGQLTARQAARRARIPLTTPSTTVNKVCLSGMSALATADQWIRLGEADVVVAGGMESMSRAPYLLPGARTGYRMGTSEVVDAMIHDGLWCAFDDEHMGAGNDRMSDRYGITRRDQDEWAARSHERAVAAWKDGRFGEEVTPIEVVQRRSEHVLVDTDEGMRPGTTAESLAALSGAFSTEGSTTPGNASQISDGAAAVVLASRPAAERLGLVGRARIRAAGSVAGPDPSLHHQPAQALRVAAAKIGLDPGGFDLYEINEAFAAVAIHSTNLLGVDPERVNVNGGAIALGHPIGCSGARLVVTLLAELARRGGGQGAASLCGGGGQGDALVLESFGQAGA